MGATLRSAVLAVSKPHARMHLLRSTKREFSDEVIQDNMS